MIIIDTVIVTLFIMTWPLWFIIPLPNLIKQSILRALIY